MRLCWYLCALPVYVTLWVGYARDRCRGQRPGEWLPTLPFEDRVHDADLLVELSEEEDNDTLPD